jgi:hypothetical protein
MSQTLSAPGIAKVRLTLRSRSLDPTEVTQRIGLAPTVSRAKGELSKRTRTPAPWGLWAVEAIADDVQPAADRLLSMIGEKRSLIAEVARALDATMAVSIWWEPSAGTGGYTLSSETLRDLSELGERVDFFFVAADARDPSTAGRGSE